MAHISQKKAKMIFDRIVDFLIILRQPLLFTFP